MMLRIHKYKIDPHSTIRSLPKGAEILSVGFQGNDFYFWAAVDTEADLETRRFQAFGTGHEMPFMDGLKYKFIGTGHMDMGLVFHAFEIIKR